LWQDVSSAKAMSNMKITANTMKTNNFYKNLFYNLIENLLILIAGIIFVISLLATMCGDGDKGLFDLL
jgi:hypothetical protein